MSNTRIQAAAEILSTPDREISPLERMQGMASAWMNATPQARAHALATSQVQGSKEIGSVMRAAAPQSLSQHVNDLLGAYVAVEREQDRLARAGSEDEAEALGEIALEARGKVLALRDRAANPDLIAARVMADLMLLHNWRRLEAGEGIEWAQDEREMALPLLEAVADRTTGVVREHTVMALATIGVEIKPQTPDPMLALIDEYLICWNAANVAETDDEADAIVRGDAMCGLFGQLANSPPSPTSIAGAAAAVRLVRDESHGSYNPDLIRNVLTVVADALDGQTVLPHVNIAYKPRQFISSAATGLPSTAQLIAFTDAAYRNRMAHLDEIIRAERTMPKGSPERQQIEQKDRALCRLYNDGLRAVIRAPVTTIEEARAKAAFLLRPEFEIADLILGDNEETILGLLRSHLHCTATVSDEQDPLLSRVTEYRTQLDAFNASPSTTTTEDLALAATTYEPAQAALSNGTVPDATTLPGAIAALRELHREFVDCGGADDMAIAMLPAVVAFFDAEAAQAMRERTAAVAGS